jgi:hypothetical protein
MKQEKVKNKISTKAYIVKINFRRGTCIHWVLYFSYYGQKTKGNTHTNIYFTLNVPIILLLANEIVLHAILIKHQHNFKSTV